VPVAAAEAALGAPGANTSGAPELCCGEAVFARCMQDSTPRTSIPGKRLVSQTIELPQAIPFAPSYWTMLSLGRHTGSSFGSRSSLSGVKAMIAVPH